MIDVNSIHITLDELLVKVQNALKGSEQEAKACIEEVFPPMYNMIDELQKRVQLNELTITDLQRQVEELE